MPVITDVCLSRFDRALAEEIIEEEEEQGEYIPRLRFSDLKIRTKQMRLVPLVPNETQEVFLDNLTAIDPGFRWREGFYRLRGVKQDVLKFRQPGISTIISAVYFINVVDCAYSKARVLAHNPKTNLDLFEMYRIFWEELPDKLRPKGRASKEDLTFFDIRSNISVLFVGSRGAGRGGTVQFLHESERAFWPPNGNQVEAGLLPSIPQEGVILRESTGNGFEEFCEQYQAAKEGKSDYKTIFLGWNIHQEYSKPVPPDFLVLPEEERLQAAYGLTAGQLAWRRSMKADLERLGKSFQAEYPLNDIEAFQGGVSNGVFDQLYLNELVDYLQGQERLGEWEAGDSGFPARLTLYAQPEEGERYVVSCDPAEGLDEAENPDFISIDVMRVSNRRQVAHLHGREGMDARTTANALHSLAAWYNGAMVIVERNNHGHAVLARLLDLYGNLYYHQEYDQFGKVKETLRPGYPKNEQTKARVDDDLAAAIRATAECETTGEPPSILITHLPTVRELLTYVNKKNGKRGGAGTSKDDRVTSLGLALFGCQHIQSGFFKPDTSPVPPKVRYGRAFVERRERQSVR